MHLDAEKAEFGRMVGAQKDAIQCASALHVAQTSYSLTCVERDSTLRLEVFARIPNKIRCNMFLHLEVCMEPAILASKQSGLSEQKASRTPSPLLLQIIYHNRTHLGYIPQATHPAASR